MKSDVAIVGAGYVGVPLAQVFAEAGRSVLLVDVDPGRVARLNAGDSYIEDVPSDALKRLVDNGLRATTDYDELRETDAILICVPTPALEAARARPDVSSSPPREKIGRRLRPGQLVVLESTTYPGTTERGLRRFSSASGLRGGRRLPPRVLARARRPGQHAT